MTQDSELDPQTDAALWQAVARVGDDPLPGEMADAAIVAGALAGLDRGIPTPSAEPSQDARPRWAAAVVVAFVGGAIAAALLLLFVGPQLAGWMSVEEPENPSLAPSVSQETGQEEEAVHRVPEPKPKAKPKAKVPPVPAAEQTPALDEPEPDRLEPAEPATNGSEPREPASGVPEPRARRYPPKANTAGEVLREARAQLKKGNKKAALARYAELQRRFPGSSEAKAALVSMGRIELRRGRAKQALAHFDAYLASSAGALRQEARYNRILSLRKLGRRGQERASIEAFLGDHSGNSMYGAKLKKRLAELEGE